MAKSTKTSTKTRVKLPPPAAQEPVLLREVRGGVVSVVLNRPRALNALNSDLRKALTDFWKEFRDDDGLKVAIVSGAGERAFSSGRDFKETALADAAGSRVSYETSGDWGYPGNVTIGKPVIAAIQGFCLAAGLMVALGCDIRICSEDAVFGNPQVARGRGTRTPLVMARAGIPRAVIMDMALTGEPLSATDAVRAGLVSRVVARDQLMPTAWRIAERIAGNSPVVVAGIKRAVETGLLDLPAHEAQPLWDAVTGMMANTADAIEGARSFAQKRRAKFD